MLSFVILSNAKNLHRENLKKRIHREILQSLCSFRMTPVQQSVRQQDKPWQPFPLSYVLASYLDASTDKAINEHI